MEKRFFKRLYGSVNYSLNNLYVNNDNNTMSNDKQTTHTCVFEKSTTSNSNEAKCKHCNNVRYLIDVKLVKNETFGGNND